MAWRAGGTKLYLVEDDKGFSCFQRCLVAELELQEKKIQIRHIAKECKHVWAHV